MFSVAKKYVLTVAVCLLGIGQGFGANCPANYVAPENPVWDGTIATSEPCTKDGYYIIDNAEKLAWYAMNYGKGNAKLTADIDLGGKLWTPIAPGKGDKKYAKIFDGNYHTIKNLYINGAELAAINIDYAQNLGFVGSLGGGTIKNLVLVVSEIYGTTSAGETSIEKPISVGTLVGWMSSGTVMNCVVEGSITTSGKDNRVGGLVGNAWNATISDCVSTVSISASGEGTHVGGIVGALRSDKNSVSTVNLSSCVFDGDTLISTGGEVGGIIGNYEKATVAKQENLYYSGNYTGVGTGSTVATTRKDDPNSEDVICTLNKGTWDDDAKTCSDASRDLWSEGQSAISMNGSDGYKITFSANGGSFGDGAKTSKIIPRNASITADEITVPTRTYMDPSTNLITNMKFAGWAITAGAEDPSEELGVADANKTLYAVWYDFYTVTFKLADTVSYSISVPKHGHVSMEGFTVPSSYKEPDAESEGDSIKYYFTGWGPEAKWLGFYIDPSTGDTVKIDPTPDDTLHLASIDVLRDTTLYPVWTRAETYSVTFDATLHGKTHVRFVKKVNNGDKVEEPNDVVTNPGYSIKGWCTNSDCTEGSAYDFDTPLAGNLTLYAEWDTLSYKITYVMNDGTNDGSNPSTYTVQSDNIIFAVPTRAGYTFEGWFYDEGFTQPATGIATNSTSGDITLHAKWTQQFYTVEYLAGNEVSGIIVADKKPWGENLILKGDEVAFRRDGYIHDGWSLTIGGDLAYNFGATYDKFEDLVLYPHWVEGATVAEHYGAVTIYTYSDNHKEAIVNGNYQGTDAVDIPEDIEVSSVTFDRTFNNTASTVVLPFDIDVGNVNGARFYNLDGIDINEETGRRVVHFKREKSLIKANTPYGVRPANGFSGETFSISFAGPVTIKKTIDVDPVITVEGQGKFTGAYENKTVSEEENGIFYGFAGKNVEGVPTGTFVRLGTGAKIPVLRAYIENLAVPSNQSRLLKPASNQSSNKKISSLTSNEYEVDWLEEDEETLIVKKQLKDVQIIRMNRVYDLKGRLMSGKMASKGVYLNKKVVTK